MKVHKRYIARLRLQDKVQPEEYDLCVPFKGGYIDIVLRYDNTWSLMVNNKRPSQYFATRTEAIDFLEKAELTLAFA